MPETSITIEDIVFVVDAGKAKEKTYDPVNKVLTSLALLVLKYKH